MTRRELKALAPACRRLALPAPMRLTASEAREARDCAGCVARYEAGIRMVYALRTCPVHGSPQTGREAPQTRRGEAVPGAALALAVARVESMRAQYKVREHGAWS